MRSFKQLPLLVGAACITASGSASGSDSICVMGPYIVEFEKGDAVIGKKPEMVLSHVVANYADCEGYSIVVDGHSRKDEAAEISMRRAIIARRYLVDHGVAARRVYLRDFGATEPGSYGDSSKARDSRVELLIAPF